MFLNLHHAQSPPSLSYEFSFRPFFLHHHGEERETNGGVGEAETIKELWHRRTAQVN